MMDDMLDRSKKLHVTYKIDGKIGHCLSNLLYIHASKKLTIIEKSPEAKLQF